MRFQSFSEIGSNAFENEVTQNREIYNNLRNAALDESVQVVSFANFDQFVLESFRTDFAATLKTSPDNPSATVVSLSHAGKCDPGATAFDIPSSQNANPRFPTSRPNTTPSLPEI